MSTQLLHFANCTPYCLAGSLNDQNSYPIQLQPCTAADTLTVPWSTPLNWSPSSGPSSNLLAANSNILMLKFTRPDDGGTVAEKYYNGLATPGYGGSNGPRPETGDLYLWIFESLILFSQYGSARLNDFGTLPPAPGWRALPI